MHLTKGSYKTTLISLTFKNYSVVFPKKVMLKLEALIFVTIINVH